MDSWSIPLPPGFIEALADQVAERLAERMAPPAEPYIDVDGAAEYIAAKPRRVYELREQGKLHAYEDGRRLLFRRSELDAYLESSG